jgi:hypothetical protein
MSLTRARIIQYIGILLALGALAAGYWYFSARASTKVNKTATSSLTSGLVGYWTFDGADVSGTTATDRSGSGNNGTLTNGPTKAIGKIGQGLSFTTGTTQHVNAGSATSLDNIVQKTICAWVLPRSYDISTVSKEFSNYTSGWNFSVDLTSRALYYYSYFGSANGEWRSASNSITLNRWQHWCVSYNNSSALNDPIFYIDSVLSPTTEISTPSGTVADDSGENLIIGNTDETNNQASNPDSLAYPTTCGVSVPSSCGFLPSATNFNLEGVPLNYRYTITVRFRNSAGTALYEGISSSFDNIASITSSISITINKIGA